jgi:hypothetical protein
MKIFLSNNSTDFSAKIFVNDIEYFIDKENQIIIDLSKPCFNLSVEYLDDFKDLNDNKAKTIKDKFENKFVNKVANFINKAILKVKNTYQITVQNDCDKIEIDYCLYEIKQNKLEKLLDFIPTIYSFGRIEADNTKINVINSTPINKKEYKKFYKKLYLFKDFSLLFLLNSIIEFIPVKIKLKSSISDKTLLKKFADLYSLSYNEREKVLSKD